MTTAAAPLAVDNLQHAKLLINQLRWAEAEPYVKAALRSEPWNATAHHFMAAICTATKRFQAGERHYRRALECLGRDDGVVLGNLAWNLRLQGRLEDCALIYERALTLRRDNLHAQCGRALVEAARGNRQRAADLLDAVLTEHPSDQQAWVARARLDLIENAPERAVGRLEGVATTADALAILGQAYERLGDIPRALSAFHEAKRRQVPAGGAYDSARYTDWAARCKETFGANRIQALPAEDDPDPCRLVVLLGFPGSGTALLEQMLARVPGVASADTLGSIADLMDAAARLLDAGTVGPELVLDLALGSGPEVAAQLRQEFFHGFVRAGLIRPETRFLTIRDPAHAWHLGFIQRLFPEARLIHCLRHPLAVMASNLAEPRMLEGNCHLSLPTLAQHYDTSMSLVQHYRAHLTMCYTAIRYEELVTAPQDALRRLAAFMGVDPADLPGEPQIRANAITAAPRAPSHQLWQEPIHTRGLHRHGAYEAVAPRLFDEVRPVLRRWIDALGYAP